MPWLVFLYCSIVTRDVAQRIAALTVTAALLAATGCSGDTDEPRAVGNSSSPSSATSPADEPTPTATPGVPMPGSMDEPATSSGPLTRSSFPTPGRLGAGWKYIVDQGSAEEGYSGNGTPTLARSPREIVQTAVPFGCSRGSVMPAPAHALEVDYALRGARVVAVRSRFADRSQAVTFFDHRERNLRACVGRSGSVAIGPLVADVRRPAPGALVSDRTPKSDPWREVSLLDGDTVVLLAVQGRDALPHSQTRRLVRLFRS